MPRRLFSARYDGECNYCYSEIQEGDDIGYVDNDIACKDCFEENQP